ncbi:hypothetical protein [Pseudoalteromonas sp. SCSIO 43201]|nr:hypothetical protein [Pseudoalteromonas sp. SCSIO 43201]
MKQINVEQLAKVFGGGNGNGNEPAATAGTYSFVPPPAKAESDGN